MERSKLACSLKKLSFLTGEFKLRSGRISSFYLDKYRFESDPSLLSSVIHELEKLLPTFFDKLAGLELGGIPLATGLSLKTGKPCLFVRKTPKKHGTCNLVEGGFEEGDMVVVIEDVVTTAEQVCVSIRQMRKLGLNVEDVLCVIDREEGGKENLRNIGCTLASVFTLDELCE